MVFRNDLFILCHLRGDLNNYDVFVEKQSFYKSLNYILQKTRDNLNQVR